MSKVSGSGRPGACPCGYTSTCSAHTALHMILEHGDGEVAITPKDYTTECLRCFYSDLEPYILVADNKGHFIQAARVGNTMLALPSVGKDCSNHGDKRYNV